MTDWLTNSVTKQHVNSIEHSSSWKANSSSAIPINYPHFTEPKRSFPCSQKSAIFHVLCQRNPIHTPLTYSFKTPYNALLPSVSRSSRQPPFITFPYPKTSARATCVAHLILLDLINQYFVGNTNNDAPQYVIFSSFLSLPPSQAQTSHSHDTLILCSSPTPHTKFHTHTKQQNYSSVYFNLHVIRQRTVRQKILHRMTADIPGVQTAINP